MRNKRADISVAILVFLTVFLCITTIFIFSNSGGIVEKKVPSVQAIPQFYADEAIFESYLKSVAKQVINENPSIENSVEFISKFQEKYSSNLQSSSLPSIYSSVSITRYISATNIYDVSIDKANKIVRFKLNNFEFVKRSTESDIVSLKIKKDISFEIYF